MNLPWMGLGSRGAGVLGATAVLFCIFLAGCGGQQTPPPQAAERRFPLRGVVISIERPQQQIVVDHEDIPGFMAAMAMPYPVTDAAQLDVAAPGDQITAEVVVTETSAHLTKIVVVKKADPAQPGGAAPPAK